MEKYTYLTLSVPYGLGKKKIARRIQKVLDAKSKEGWRLSKFDISDLLGICVLIFEKELIQELQKEKKPEKVCPLNQETIHDGINSENSSAIETSENLNEEIME